MATLYQKALVIGGTSGIGEGTAAKFVKEGTKVIITGRSEKVAAVAFDVTKLKEIPFFAKSIGDNHLDVDCIVVNSGIQRLFNFAKAETVDLTKLDEETTTNYTAYVHLTTAFLPFLQRQNNASLVSVSATLVLIPGMLRTPNYNAVKAALHSWIMVMREQLKRAGNNIKVVEVFPPAVQTELHDTRHQPDLRNGGQIGMPLIPFTDKMYEGLQKGDDQFAIGHGEPLLTGWEVERTKLFHKNMEMVEEALRNHVI